MANIANIDLRLLRVFITIVECGGFSAAQAELNISQSTISNHMIALEERLRCKLCQRGRSGFALTEHGKAVYEAAVRLFSSLEEFRVETESLHGMLTGDLRIGVVDNTVTDPRSPIADALQRFTARANSVNIKLIVDSPPALQRQVVDRRLDVAILGFAPRLPNLSYKNLYVEASALYCSDRHPLFQIPDADLTLGHIRRQSFAGRSYWCNQDTDLVGVTKAAASVEQMEAQLMLVLSGAFIGFLPIHYAKHWVQEGRLKPLLADDISYAVRFHLITRKGVRTTPTLKAFIQDVYNAVGTLVRKEREGSEVAHFCSWQSRRVRPDMKIIAD